MLSSEDNAPSGFCHCFSAEWIDILDEIPKTTKGYRRRGEEETGKAARVHACRRRLRESFHRRCVHEMDNIFCLLQTTNFAQRFHVPYPPNKTKTNFYQVLFQTKTNLLHKGNSLKNRKIARKRLLGTQRHCIFSSAKRKNRSNLLQKFNTKIMKQD